MRRPLAKTAPAPATSAASATEKEIDFKALAEGTSEVIIRCNVDGIATYVSPSIFNLLGLTPDAIIGRSHRAFILAEDLPALNTTVEAHRAGRVNGLATYRMRRADGAIVWVETSGRRVDDSGPGADDYIIVMRDISERKALEAKLSLLALTGSTAQPAARGAAGYNEPGRSEPRETRHKPARTIN